MADRYTQFVCYSQPYCLCVGEENEWDECDCFQPDQQGLFRSCAGCKAQLTEIDFETGEAIAA